MFADKRVQHDLFAKTLIGNEFRLREELILRQNK